MELSPWYFGLKLAAYTAWMFVGLGVMASGSRVASPGRDPCWARCASSMC